MADFRPTWAFIDLNALIFNYNTILNQLPLNMGMLAMIKADAYGHGAVQVARVLSSSGITALGVATVEEGLELRDSGIDTPILIMGGLMGGGYEASLQMIRAHLTPVIHSADAISALRSAAIHMQCKVSAHLKIDTGMSRLGIRPEVLPALLEDLHGDNNIDIVGCMTHFSDASDDAIIAHQYDVFCNAKQIIEDALGPIPLWHMANSDAILGQQEILETLAAEKTWARPGVSLYGIANPKIANSFQLRPVLSLMSKVVFIKHVPANSRISYGGEFVTSRSSRIAILPIGYADGYPCHISTDAYVLIRGQRCPIIGRVTMDMIIVDITDFDDIRINDEVALIGTQGIETVDVNMLAKWASTISYEIVCQISKRIPRKYVGEI